MIILLRFKSFMLISLIILSISFIYIGYIGMEGETGEMALTDELPIELHEPLRVLNEKTEVNDNFFAQFRMERDRGRDGEIEILREVINNAYSSIEVREEAQRKLISISANKAQEIKAENALKSKGYENVVVIVEEENITVIVPQKEVNEINIVRISDLIVRTIDVDLENIAIIPQE